MGKIMKKLFHIVNTWLKCQKNTKTDHTVSGDLNVRTGNQTTETLFVVFMRSLLIEIMSNLKFTICKIKITNTFLIKRL